MPPAIAPPQLVQHLSSASHPRMTWASQIAFGGKTLAQRGIFRAVAELLRSWHQRRRSRLALSRLDGHLLRDIGLSATQAQNESRKARWYG